MAKLKRFTMPVFAGNAAQNQTSVFGTMKTSPQYTTDVAASIGTAAYGKGWADAIDLGYAPFMEDMNTLQRAITYQIAYNQQQGIPEWASDTTYYKDSLVKYNTGSGAQIYASLANNNVGNLLSNTTKWKLVLDTANRYVTINTTETITGAKTFENQLNVRMPSDAFGYRAQNTSVARGTTPANTVNYQWVAQDNDGLDINHRLGGMYVYYGANGNIYTDLVAYKPEAYNETTNPNTNAVIRIAYPKTGSPYTYAPNPSLSSDASGYTGQIVTVGYLNGNSSGVVHTSGNETIGGNKTFTGDAVYNSRLQMLYDTAGTNGVFIQNTAITKGTTPTSATESAARIVFNGAGGSTVNYRIGSFETGYYDDGSIQTFMRAYKPTANNNTNAILGLVYPASGNPYGTAPTPSANVVGNEIITAKWYMPNYSKATNKSAETKYTPTKDVRVIIAGTISSSGDRQNMEARVQINDADKFTLYGGYVYGYNEDPFYVAFDVKAGNSYKLYKVSGTLTVKQFIEIPYGG